MPWEYKSPPKHRTPRARAKQAYRDMKQRCGNANGRNPAYNGVELRMTEEEWLEWSIPLYEEFQRENADTSPSVSRIADSGHYELGNLEIMSVAENRRRQVRASRITLRCVACGRGYERLKSRVLDAEKSFCSKQCVGAVSGRKRGPIKHGTIGAYNNRGCRCDKCKAARNEAQRQYRLCKRSKNMPP